MGEQPHVHVARQTCQGRQHPAEVRAASLATSGMACHASQEDGEGPSRGLRPLVEAEAGRGGQ